MLSSLNHLYYVSEKCVFLKIDILFWLNSSQKVTNAVSFWEEYKVFRPTKGISAFLKSCCLFRFEWQIGGFTGVWGWNGFVAIIQAPWECLTQSPVVILYLIKSWEEHTSLCVGVDSDGWGWGWSGCIVHVYCYHRHWSLPLESALVSHPSNIKVIRTDHVCPVDRQISESISRYANIFSFKMNIPHVIISVVWNGNLYALVNRPAHPQFP